MTTTNSGAHVRVGHIHIPLQTAVDWVRRYTDIEENTTGTFAYPAYDRYQPAEEEEPTRLTDVDLLAPTLLNVPPRIRSFYGLQRIRSTLEEGPANEDLAIPLARLNEPERIAAMVKPLYGVLDDPTTRPWRVRATFLSKVLHRKRPQSLVLHDKWVRACYYGDGKPVPPVEGRSSADYMTAITSAIGHDVRTQPEAFARLDAAAHRPGELSQLRLIDILAWTSAGTSPPTEGSTDIDGS